MVLGCLLVIAPLLSLWIDLVLFALIFVVVIAASLQGYVVYRRTNARTS